MSIEQLEFDLTDRVDHPTLPREVAFDEVWMFPREEMYTALLLELGPITMVDDGAQHITSTLYYHAVYDALSKYVNPHCPIHSGTPKRNLIHEYIGWLVRGCK